ncbi:MAG TPA: hypothetical protein VIX11_14570 [Candidatus Acidoferrum sp.]
MFRKLLFAGFLPTLLVLAPAAAQQSPASTPVPPSSGLLLAHIAHQRNSQVLGSPSVVQYETLWIVRDAAGARIIATLPDIVIPRKTGFWRLGIQHACQLRAPEKGDPTSRGNISTADLPYAVPADKAPILEVQYPLCDSETTKRVFDDTYDSEPSNYDSPPKPDAPSECGWYNLWFESVLPDLISVGSFTGQSETCEPRGGHLYSDFWVQSPDSPMQLYSGETQKIPFEQLFGAAGDRAYIKALSGGGPDGDSCASDSPPEDLSRTGWYLRHGQGEWYTSAFIQPSGFCVASGSPKVIVPRSLTHAVPLPVPWSALRKQLPDLADAYVSPGASVLLALQSKQDPNSHVIQILSVALFDFSGNKLGPKLLELPPTDLVMVEWATGRFISSWTDSLTALQSHGLPSPSFKVLTSPN